MELSKGTEMFPVDKINYKKLQLWVGQKKKNSSCVPGKVVFVVFKRWFCWAIGK